MPHTLKLSGFSTRVALFDYGDEMTKQNIDQSPAAGDALDVLLLTQALQDLRQAFVIAVGDKSPFARIALEKADSAIAQQKGEA